MHDLDLDAVADDAADVVEGGLLRAGQHAHVDERLRAVGDDVVLVPGGQARGIGRRAQRGPDEAGCRARALREGVGIARVVTRDVGEARQERTRGVGESDGPFGATEGRDGLGESGDGVVGVQTAAVSGPPAGDELDPDEGLLPDLQQVGAAVADGDRVAAHLADGLGGAGEPLGAVLHDACRALDAAVLLVGEERHDHVALGLLPRAQQIGDGGQDHGIHVLHVDRSAAPQDAVADLSREGIDAPVLGDGGHHVEVSVQDQCRLVAVATRHAGADVGAALDGLVVRRVEPRPSR